MQSHKAELKHFIFDTSTEMGKLVCEFDWSQTPLGPMEKWPQSLKTNAQHCLDSRFPSVIWWGPELIQIYNDGYRVICGAKHPKALGQRAQDCWMEMWDATGPLVTQVFETGKAIWIENSVFSLVRSGYLEEAYFTFSYSPLRDESGKVAGIFETVTEVTTQILARRRLTVLQELGEQTVASTVRDACHISTDILARHPYDLPFALIYLLDENTHSATLVGHAGINKGLKESPITISLNEKNLWHLDEVLKTRKPTIIQNLDSKSLPGGPWTESPQCAVVLPIIRLGNGFPYGFLIAGISPRRALDESYFEFLRLIVQQLSRSITATEAYEQERKRSEALAEIDRAKTTFFSNVSHEFRTPLTLILGPLEDMISGKKGDIPIALRSELEIIHRNSLRLLKLVNALLDFSRFEAGRVQALYEATDLASITQDLASTFRSAIESAGMRLIVDCEPLPEPVFIDRDMWEKIVLNLLSNAFKYTLKGEIRVQLKLVKNTVELTVSDTGIGIPEAELSKIFQRFHRVQGARGRTQEGTGIGLALVQELTKLHGGSVRVKSEYGKGSTFTVTIPTGISHLPKDKLSTLQFGDERLSTAVEAKAYTAEALRWLPNRDEIDNEKLTELQADNKKKRIILADDNADMRDYVKKLLSHRYEVIAVNNGQQALEVVRKNHPDLILTDIMMPIMDGIELLKNIRSDTSLRTIPVILLSARAGEEAKASGIIEGADDYLTKPFSSKELLARIQTQLQMAEVRQKAAVQETIVAQLTSQQQWLENILNLMPTPLLIVEPSTGYIQFANRAAHQMAGGTIPLDIPIEKYQEIYHFTDDAGKVVPVDQLPSTRAARGEKIHNAEVVWHTPAGHFSLLVDSEKVPALPGQPPRVILCLWDVSHMKKYQAELRRLISTRDEFLSIASHELKTPLTALKLKLQMASRKMKSQESPTPSLLYYLSEIFVSSLRQVDSLTNLVEDLLDISRVRLGKFELQKEEVNLSEITAEVLSRFSFPLAQAKCSVESHLDRSIIGFWDRNRIEQIINNLMSNIIKYAPASHVTVTNTLTEDKQSAEITIQDTGPGIPKEKHQKIFDRFERGVESMSISGLGLGLFITKNIIQAHHGTISIESEREKGTKFIIKLPLRI